MVSTKKIPSLGSAVRDYTEGLSFLRLVLVVTLPLTLFSLSRGAFLVSIFLFSLSAIAIYGVVRISLWLPSISAPGYELFLESCDDNDVRNDFGMLKNSFLSFFRKPTTVMKSSYHRRILVADDELPWARPSLERAAVRRVAEMMVPIEKKKKTMQQMPSSKLVVRAVLRARYSDRLGNRLFQYAWARLRAAHLGCDFEAPPMSGPWADNNSLALFVPATTSPSSPQRQLSSLSVATGGTLGSLCSCAMSDAASSAYCMDARAIAAHDDEVKEWLRPGLDKAVSVINWHHHKGISGVHVMLLYMYVLVIFYGDIMQPIDLFHYHFIEKHYNSSVRDWGQKTQKLALLLLI